MPRFRILYLASDRVDGFLLKAPSKAPYRIRRSHYQEGPEIESPGPYELWRSLLEQHQTGAAGAGRPLGTGDALCTDDDTLLLCNYWGFDPAEWWDAKSVTQIAKERPETRELADSAALQSAA